MRLKNVKTSKKNSSDFKLKVVLKYLSEDTTVAQICQEFNVSKATVHKWANQFKGNSSLIFNESSLSKGNDKKKKDLCKSPKYGDLQRSLDGKGRWVDNVFIERSWRTIKQEQIYINPPDSIKELRKQIDDFIGFYNNQRPHQSLNYKTPSQIYFEDEDRRKVIDF